MAEKLTTIRPPKNDYSWPKTGLVQLGPAIETGLGQRHRVFLDGQEIGRIESYQSRPSENVPGTRIRRELKPRLVWKTYRGTGLEGTRSSRVSYTARVKAIRALLIDRLENPSA